MVLPKHHNPVKTGRQSGVLGHSGLPTFWVKLWNWEFWSFPVVYASLGFLHVWQSIKARSFFYMAASNPGLENSGFIGERKSTIMHSLPPGFQPAWFLVHPAENGAEWVLDELEKAGLRFPVICKPNIGERGRGVKRIESETDLLHYHVAIGVDYLIQGFVDLPLELGVFYYRLPGTERGTVSSIVLKKFLEVTGDGQSTLRELVQTYPRARFVARALEQKFSEDWGKVVPEGQVVALEGIGNHCRGTTFLDANGHINSKINRAFDQVAGQIPGFYFGRFDIRAASWEAVEAGDFQILELNGAGAEPGHIYQPGYPFLKGQKVLWDHWIALFKISVANHKEGVSYWNWSQAREIRKAHQKALASIGIS